MGARVVKIRRRDGRESDEGLGRAGRTAAARSRAAVGSEGRMAGNYTGARGWARDGSAAGWTWAIAAANDRPAVRAAGPPRSETDRFGGFRFLKSIHIFMRLDVPCAKHNAMIRGREYGIVTAVASSASPVPSGGSDHGQHHSDAVRRQADHDRRGIEQRHRPSRRGDESGNLRDRSGRKHRADQRAGGVNLASGVTSTSSAAASRSTARTTSAACSSTPAR